MIPLQLGIVKQARLFDSNELSGTDMQIRQKFNAFYPANDVIGSFITCCADLSTGDKFIIRKSLQ